jgi:hypothetical protein
MADNKYNAAAKIVNDLRPNQRENDSSTPPSREPNKFDPRAFPRNPARAKLEMKIMPAKKTGRQRTMEATIARKANDSTNRLRIGTANMTAKERNKAA